MNSDDLVQRVPHSMLVGAFEAATQDLGFTSLNQLNMTFKQFIREFHREESGDDLLEYALVVAVVLATVMSGSTRLATTVLHELAKIIRDIKKLVHKAF